MRYGWIPDRADLIGLRIIIAMWLEAFRDDPNRIAVIALREKIANGAAALDELDGYWAQASVAKPKVD